MLPVEKKKWIKKGRKYKLGADYASLDSIYPSNKKQGVKP